MLGIWLTWPLACFAAAVVAHGVAMRIPVDLNSVRRFLILAVPIGLALAITLALESAWTSRAIAALAVYAFLCELYVFLFTRVRSSISASMLISLRDGPATEADLLRAHDAKALVRQRINGLIAAGWVLREGGRLTVSPSGLRIHRGFDRLRKLVSRTSTVEG